MTTSFPLHPPLRFLVHLCIVVLPFCSVAEDALDIWDIRGNLRWLLRDCSETVLREAATNEVLLRLDSECASNLTSLLAGSDEQEGWFYLMQMESALNFGLNGYSAASSPGYHFTLEWMASNATLVSVSNLLRIQELASRFHVEFEAKFKVGESHFPAVAYYAEQGLRTALWTNFTRDVGAAIKGVDTNVVRMAFLQWSRDYWINSWRERTRAERLAAEKFRAALATYATNRIDFHPEAMYEREVEEIHTIAAACISYAADHDDMLPAKLSELEYMLGTNRPGLHQTDILVTGRLSAVKDRNNTVLLKLKLPLKNGRRVIANANGTCFVVSDEELKDWRAPKFDYP